jgi:hypothetical protein
MFCTSSHIVLVPMQLKVFVLNHILEFQHKVNHRVAQTYGKKIFWALTLGQPKVFALGSIYGVIIKPLHLGTLGSLRSFCSGPHATMFEPLGHFVLAPHVA